MNSNSTWPEPTQLVMVPKEYLQELSDKISLVLNLVNKNASPVLPEWITEAEARKSLGKGKTWFYNLRSTGQLKGRKVGGTVYYKLAELNQFLEESQLTSTKS